MTNIVFRGLIIFFVFIGQLRAADERTALVARNDPEKQKFIEQMAKVYVDFIIESTKYTAAKKIEETRACSFYIQKLFDNSGYNDDSLLPKEILEITTKRIEQICTQESLKLLFLNEEELSKFIDNKVLDKWSEDHQPYCFQCPVNVREVSCSCLLVPDIVFAATAFASGMVATAMSFSATPLVIPTYLYGLLGASGSYGIPRCCALGCGQLKYKVRERWLKEDGEKLRKLIIEAAKRYLASLDPDDLPKYIRAITEKDSSKVFK